jgi:hypothetical protein
MTIEVATGARVFESFVLLVVVRSYHESSFREPHSATKDEILEVVVVDFKYRGTSQCGKQRWARKQPQIHSRLQTPMLLSLKSFQTRELGFFEIETLIKDIR